MKVFIAGATGVLGRRLVCLLRDRGHDVVALARSDDKARWLENQSARASRASLFDPRELAKAADGCTAVVHVATSIPRKAHTSRRDWEENDRIRREGTRALTTCAAVIGARTYVQQSVVWVARPSDGSPFDEDAPPNDEPLMQSALDGERMALATAEQNGFKAAVLRCGWFYSSDATHTQMFGEGLRRRRIPIVGSGDAQWSLLHLDDAAHAFLAAIEQSRHGIWHVVDDQPATVQDFLTRFASLLNAKPPRTVPAWLARFPAGKQAVEFFTTSTRTANDKFRRDFNWRPCYSTYREGLAQVVADWKAKESRAFS